MTANYKENLFTKMHQKSHSYTPYFNKIKIILFKSKYFCEMNNNF